MGVVISMPAKTPAVKANHARELYLDLMKRCLTNWVYGDTEEAACPLPEPLAAQVAQACAPAQVRTVRPQPFDPAQRLVGRDWPPYAHTMVGMQRLENVGHCVRTLIEDEVPGDFIETGVWRGGTTIFMRAMLKAYGITDRTVWVADSFEGLPPPNEARYPQDAGDKLHTIPFLAVSVDQVKANFAKYDLLDEQVQFLK